MRCDELYPNASLVIFTESAAFLKGNACPHGVPSGASAHAPMPENQQRELDEWQLYRHAQVEEQLGMNFSGYCTFVREFDRWPGISGKGGHTTQQSAKNTAVGGSEVSSDSKRAGKRLPLVLREKPDVVGTKIWRGEWLLWKLCAYMWGWDGVEERNDLEDLLGDGKVGTVLEVRGGSGLLFSVLLVVHECC